LRKNGRLNNGLPQADAVREWMRESGADVIARIDDLLQVDGIGFTLADKPPVVGSSTFQTVTPEMVLPGAEPAVKITAATGVFMECVSNHLGPGMTAGAVRLSVAEFSGST
jgi:hypothetical protein